MNKPATLALAAALLCGCASYDGRGLQPGKSTAAEVEALMGPPAERRPTADGGGVAYFTRAPVGRHTYAATFGPEGRLLSMEQVLTYANAGKLAPGTTTRKEVRELLGPPGVVSSLPRQQREVWEYKWLYYDEKRVLWVQFSADGIVREAINMHDYESDPVSGRRRR